MEGALCLDEDAGTAAQGVGRGICATDSDGYLDVHPRYRRCDTSSTSEHNPLPGIERKERILLFPVYLFSNENTRMRYE
eukprot:2769417-Pyramimonas_sp.AAC.1